MSPHTSQRTDDQVRQLKFRDPERARGLSRRLHELMAEIDERHLVPERLRPPGRPLCVMHVCGSHEQAIAKYGLRGLLPDSLDLIMGPGCPVCVTDVPEVDEAVALALEESSDGRPIHVATYGDMLRVPGTVLSLADAQARGGRVHVVYGIPQAVELARSLPDEEVVFFASGFETTAVTTAAAVVATEDGAESSPGVPSPGVPPNFSILSAHKYIPPAMVLVSEMPETRIAGYLAAGHAATITGSAIFEPIAERQGVPIVVAGFEPLDILAALVRLVELIRDGATTVENLYPRCVTPEGNTRALELLWRVFRPVDGKWRGIAEIPDGNLRLRPEWAHLDARVRFDVDPSAIWRRGHSEQADPHVAACEETCLCGAIMAGLAKPTECPHFGVECTPEAPVGACMVSSEGTCKIWHLYGGRPDLAAA